MSDVRANAGLHEYDGRIQDLSPDGIRAGLARLGQGPALDDPHDEAQLAATERSLHLALGQLELHRRNPLFHLDNLDVVGYVREYAPADERAAARERHLAAWPDGVDMAIASLDRDSLPAPVAEALLPAVRGLAAELSAANGPIEADALAAHTRLVTHLEEVARVGPPEVAMGAGNLARYLAVSEALPTDVDLQAQAEQADRERDRLRGLLDEACHQVAPDQSTADTVGQLLADHPDAEGILEEARVVTEEAIAFARDRDLVPFHDGDCIVETTPESLRWAMAFMSWASPEEADVPSRYWITPPDSSWTPEEIEEWLQVFSRATLPAITVHEVAPGHFSHGRALRRAPTDVRRLLQSAAFIEGWAHYGEELCWEEGFRAGDTRFLVGVALEALVRVTRMACAIGVHSGAMTVDDAAARFERDAFMGGSAARSEANRATFDPTYGRYTWGKLEILELRDQARAAWGADFSLSRFHRALLDLGAPPLGLMRTAIERG